MFQPSMVIVGHPSDRLASNAASQLESRNIWVQRISPDALGDLSVTLGDGRFQVEGRMVHGILFRAFPDTRFSADFERDDQLFANVEIGATWLAAMQLRTLVAINQYDATNWFEGLNWRVWRQLLVRAAVPVSPFAFGDTLNGTGGSWMPFATGVPEPPPPEETRRAFGTAITSSTAAGTSLVVGSAIIGCKTDSITAAAETLAKCGVRFAQIAIDEGEHVLSIDPQPVITDELILARATDALVEYYHAHLYRR